MSQVDPDLVRPSRAHQVGGTHYLGRAYQPWDIIEDWELDFWEGNALKYLLRRKPGVARAEDLRKAIHYIEHAIARAEEDALCVTPGRV